jgi:hypothetical protein
LVAGLCVAQFWSATATANSLAELNFFEGRWTIKGIETTYTEECAWVPGGRFLSCQSEDSSKTPHEFGTSVFGFSESEQVYSYAGFNGSGSTRQLRGILDAGIWRFFGQSEHGPEWRRWQVLITPAETGFHYQEEVSVRGGPWEKAVTLDYIRTNSR